MTNDQTDLDAVVGNATEAVERAIGEGGEDDTLVSEGDGLTLADLRTLLAALAEARADAARLGWMEGIIRGSVENGYCEVYLSGLRRSITHLADEFQFETNPNHLGTTTGSTLRAAIDAARAGGAK